MRRRWCLLGIVIALATLSTESRAQETAAITGDRLSGFVLPIEPLPGDINIDSLRAWTWTVDDTKRLLLEGDVHITIGPYDFESSEAVVWLNRIPSAGGLINQIAIYFPGVSDPTEAAGLGVAGNKVLVTGSARGKVNLSVALLKDAQPNKKELLSEAEGRLAGYLKSLLAAPPRLADTPQLNRPAPVESFVPVPGGSVKSKDLELPGELTLPPVVGATPWLASPQGTVRFSAEKTEIVPGETENTIIIIGAIVVEYQSLEADGNLSQLSLSAQRGVIFTDPATVEGMAQGQLKAASVRGIYLEGNVSVNANNGQYTVRAPQVYYDFGTGRALMVKSLLRTFPRNTKVPVHARAEEMRQLAANQWQATKASVSTSEFAVPHISLGAEKATITERAVGDGTGETETYVQSTGNTLRIEGVPIIPLPPFSGTVDRVPLKSATLGTATNDGVQIETAWDLFSLLGKDPPPGVEAQLNLDGYTKRGPGGGVELKYDVGDAEGAVDLYGMYDNGTDRTSSGRDVEPETKTRGVALMEYQTDLSRYWSAQVQMSYISDPTFITSRRPDDFADRREYETSLYLKHQYENAAFTVLAKYDLNDFISNDYLLASKAYSVDKLPEATYRRYGDSLFGDYFSFSTENRLSRMNFNFQDTTPQQIGVRPGAFPFPITQNIRNQFYAQGYPGEYVSRVDTRNELTMPLHWGMLNVMPFVVGRFTGYTNDFAAFSSDSDDMRFYGAAGLRMSTQFAKIDDAAENRLFDIHRMRHVVEPYMTLWLAESSVDQADLPVYDTAVESLVQGTAVQLGLLNTWQTQRGGPGQWRSVDLFTLDAAVVFTSEGDDESPTPQFFDYRPEYSQFGDHIRGTGVWLVSDSLSLLGTGVWDLDENVMARGSIGAELRHTPLLTTYIEYRFIDASSSELLAIGWTYQLTPKYQVAIAPQWDFRADDLRSMNFKLTRSFPDFDFTLAVRYDQIADETSVGASLNIAEF